MSLVRIKKLEARILDLETEIEGLKAECGVRPGDIWNIERKSDGLRYVMLVLGHHRRRRCMDGHTFVFLYHWDEPSLRSRPADLRDNDCATVSAEALMESFSLRDHNITRLGNLFDMLPLAKLLAKVRVNP